MTENNAAQPGLNDTIRAVFLGHGFTIKEGQTDLKPYVYEAVHALLSKLRAEGVQAGGYTPTHDQPHQTGVGEWCAPGPAADQRRAWLLRFADTDRGDCVYYDEQEARRAFAQAEGRGWNCYLFEYAARAALASAPVAGEALRWRVRERRSNDGELLDCFVEAPAAPGMAYAQEVLGDDYAEAQGGIEGKLKHCQMIVAWANAAPEASAEPLARYCPGCGSVGPVGDEYRDCYPDGIQARMIPARLAEQCRDTFRLAIKSLLADAAANDSAAPQASEAVRDAALEEAAKVAESTVAGDASPDNPYRGGTAKQAAARIRALKSQIAALSEPKCPRCTLPLRQECNCDEGYAARAARATDNKEQ
ncbi:hypothetical protein [Achromobacter piechaudii]|uniref:Phage protein n=1 Tax=Achromobacter piechaudii TaxID=72556 RepID=A0ABM8L2V9_9BURK|nr:hypothetical protein [Achromobacter piechaudii]CAB3729243.1 hypothetical protein LMG1873_04656 [Achromobacter piechaudii]